MNALKKLLTYFFLASSALAAPVKLIDQEPVAISTLDDGVTLIDFGRVAFGNLIFHPPADDKGKITILFGEAFSAGRINRQPPGSVRYAKTVIDLAAGKAVLAAPAANKRNTEQNSAHHPPAILTPSDWGVILPFRWVEIEEWPGKLSSEHITRQAAFSATWDDDAASFHCSDPMLNRIWELCRYSIKATTFAGVYVDGDRERIPYEADAYLNQLSHYATDNDTQLARDTYDHLMRHGTWPTEWASHMVMMAHADWMHTGEIEWLRPRYARLKEKLLLERVGEHSLVTSTQKQMRKGDIVDWPIGERDGYVFTSVNTVVNAFFLHALNQMADLAEALGETNDVRAYRSLYARSHTHFQELLFDQKTGLYRDGIGTDHSSIHANFTALAFDLVPEKKRAAIIQWLNTRGMRCSVYAAQYLLEALFEHGASNEALKMITANNDRSWKHMVESGTTITWEAWDQKYKPNQDWNHAWGAAPANLFPRYILGAEPLEPGWQSARIRPHLADLQSARGKIPTSKGPIHIDWKMEAHFHLTLKLPDGMSAQLELPAPAGSRSVFCNGSEVPATKIGNRWLLDSKYQGSCQFEVRH